MISRAATSQKNSPSRPTQVLASLQCPYKLAQEGTEEAGFVAALAALAALLSLRRDQSAGRRCVAALSDSFRPRPAPHLDLDLMVRRLEVFLCSEFEQCLLWGLPRHERQYDCVL